MLNSIYEMVYEILIYAEINICSITRKLEFRIVMEDELDIFILIIK